MAKYVFPFPKKDIPKGGEFGNTILFDGTKRANPHRGVDGPPEFAIAVTDATVVTNKWSDGLGNMLVIQDEKGTYWGYNHLRSAPVLGLGQKVKCGDKLAVVGNTGSFSHGRHLHFTCSNHIDGNQSGVVFDPFEILEKRMAAEAAKAAPVAKVSAPAEAPAPVAAADTPKVDAKRSPQRAAAEAAKAKEAK